MDSCCFRDVPLSGCFPTNCSKQLALCTSKVYFAVLEVDDVRAHLVLGKPPPVLQPLMSFPTAWTVCSYHQAVALRSLAVISCVSILQQPEYDVTRFSMYIAPLVHLLQQSLPLLLPFATFSVTSGSICIPHCTYAETTTRHARSSLDRKVIVLHTNSPSKKHAQDSGQSYVVLLLGPGL